MESSLSETVDVVDMTNVSLGSSEFADMVNVMDFGGFGES